MKIDPDYLKKMLETFEAAPAPIFYVSDFQDAGLNFHDHEFIFHLGVLADQGFVARDDRKPGFGLQRGADGSASWSIVPLRLTAEGHHFIEALKNKEVWATLKKDFKDASLSTLWDVSKKLLEGFAKKKIEGILNGGV
jgi:Hypothetical protein (DUF2513)